MAILAVLARRSLWGLLLASAPLAACFDNALLHEQKPIPDMHLGQTVASAAAVAISAASAQATVDAPSTLPGNSLVPVLYKPLPLGRITPSGWLQAELQAHADGLAGHEHDFYKYVASSTWLGGDFEYSDLREGFPYWFNGMVPLAYSLNDERLKSQVHTTASYILDHQQSDGWIGPEATGYRTFWGRYPVLLGLIGLMEANSTWETPVLTAMHKFNGLMNTMMKSNYSGYLYQKGDHIGTGDFDWGRVRSQDLMISLMWLYENHPMGNEASLVQNMNFLHQAGLNWEDWFNPGTYIFDDLYDLPKSVTDQHYSYLHGVNVAQGLKATAVVRRLTHNDSLIQTSKNGVDWTFKYHGAASGTVIADERIDGLAPYSGSELCSAVEAMYSLSYLYQALGDASYADRCELAAFNALPVMVTGDWWAHQYMAQPNQPYSHDLSATPFYNTNSWSQTFGLELNYPCCTVNHHQGFPKFLANSYVAAGSNGLVHALLSPGSVTTTLANGAKVTVDCQTNYPFGDSLAYTIDSSAPFDFYIRKPAWAPANSAVTVNGASVSADASTSLYHVAVQQGKASVAASFPAPIKTQPRANDTVAVLRGPLLYALAIASHTTTSAPRDYQNKTVLPSSYAPPQARDYTMTNASAWNVAIDPSSLQYHGAAASGASIPGNIFAEGAPPMYISARACEIDWPLLKGSVPGPAPPKASRRCLGDVFEARLAPYGSAKLHMAELPTVNLSGM